jgi:hypothetical protein
MVSLEGERQRRRFADQSASSPWHTVPSHPSSVQWQTAQNSSQSVEAAS